MANTSEQRARRAVVRWVFVARETRGRTKFSHCRDACTASRGGTAVLPLPKSPQFAALVGSVPCAHKKVCPRKRRATVELVGCVRPFARTKFDQVRWAVPR